jgi:hypothetical protein
MADVSVGTVIFIQIKINVLARSKDVQIATNWREILKVH